jgi:hypothetical protein
VQNLITKTLEFSAGGQVQTVELPYMSVFNQLPISSDYGVNSLQHAMVYIYLLQPLVLNGTVSGTVNFNVYLSGGDDLQFYGFSTTNFAAIQTGEPAFRAQAAVATKQSEQTQLLIHKDTPTDHWDCSDMRPIVSVRDYARRVIYATEAFSTPTLAIGNHGIATVQISELVGKSAIDDGQEVTPLQMLGRMFYGYNGGLKFKIVATGASDLKVYYVPPGVRSSIESFPNQEMIHASTFFPILSSPSSTQVRGNLFPRTNKSVNVDSRVTEFPLTMIEKPNYHQVTEFHTLTGDWDSSDNTSMFNASTVVMEGTIPNYNPFRFVGSYSAGRIPVTSTAGHYLPVDDMGQLVLVAQPKAHIETEAPTFSGIFYRIAVGATDESRFGFQTMFLPVEQITDVTVSPNFLIGVDNAGDMDVGPAPVSHLPRYKYSYWTKPS